MKEISKLDIMNLYNEFGIHPAIDLSVKENAINYAMVSFLITCFKHDTGDFLNIKDQCLRLVRSITKDAK